MSREKSLEAADHHIDEIRARLDFLHEEGTQEEIDVAFEELEEAIVVRMHGRKMWAANVSWDLFRAELAKIWREMARKIVEVVERFRDAFRAFEERTKPLPYPRSFAPVYAAPSLPKAHYKASQPNRRPALPGYMRQKARG